MYADDLVLISRTKEGLQRQIDCVKNYCQKWKLTINIKKTKSMVFNRGNKLIDATFHVGDSPIENVKSFTYLGFTICAKNCSFQKTMDDLSLKANRAVFAIKSKIKLSQLPMKLAIKIFNTQIVPILLYGSEVWGPYMNFDYTSWDQSRTERIQTQFIKQVLGCNFQTSNNMARADSGCRPLINNIIKRFILYTKNVNSRPFNLCHDALKFEKNNNETPNFCKYLHNYSLDMKNLLSKSKLAISKICQENYDRFWKEKILQSSKATYFCKFKLSIGLEKHLKFNFNIRHKKAISRFRMSNHTLMIEKGRHKKIERNERKCYFCKDKIEDEVHFLVNCPLYTSQRNILVMVCNEICIRFANYSEEQKIIFLMSNEHEKVIKALGKYIFESLGIRDKIVAYFFS